MKNESAFTAKAIRAELKKAFPSIKFNVTSERYSGGNSVHIEYTDGVTTDKVEAVVKKYQYGEVCSMEDTYDITNAIAGLPQVKFVNIARKKSAAVIAELLNEVRAVWGDCKDGEDFLPNAGEYAITMVHRLFVTRSY
jgi:hypothetical protein